MFTRPIGIDAFSWYSGFSLVPNYIRGFVTTFLHDEPS